MKSTTRSKILAGTALAALTASVAAIGAAGTVHWGYHGEDGPESWGSLKDDSGHTAFPTCALGQEQSPVDISGFGEEDGQSIDFDYEATPLVVKNNGHTIQVDYGDGSSISIGGDTYKLLQFHFHTPSEHTVMGEPYPMEGHLVHARGEGDAMELAVVGFLIEQGDHNDAMQSIWNVMPATEGTVEADGVMINAADLLPGDDAGEEYYAYAGSLTTPPCSEGVRWQVLEEPIEASEAQIAAFRELFDLNARPVQDLNGREVSLVED